jgi:hypothetical protein
VVSYLRLVRNIILTLWVAVTVLVVVGGDVGTPELVIWLALTAGAIALVFRSFVQSRGANVSET